MIDVEDDVRNLKVAIIGAGMGSILYHGRHLANSASGMGGLASALGLAKKGFSNINIYENASNLGFVGAGIQLAPNLVRILSRLDCWESIQMEATEVLETSIRGMSCMTAE